MAESTKVTGSKENRMVEEFIIQQQESKEKANGLKEKE